MAEKADGGEPTSRASRPAAARGHVGYSKSQLHGKTVEGDWPYLWLDDLCEGAPGRAQRLRFRSHPSGDLRCHSRPPPPRIGPTLYPGLNVLIFISRIPASKVCEIVIYLGNPGQIGVKAGVHPAQPAGNRKRSELTPLPVDTIRSVAWVFLRPMTTLIFIRTWAEPNSSYVLIAPLGSATTPI